MSLKNIEANIQFTVDNNVSYFYKSEKQENEVTYYLPFKHVMVMVVSHSVLSSNLQPHGL